MRKGFDVCLAMAAYLNPGERCPSRPFPSALRGAGSSRLQVPLWASGREEARYASHQ